MRARAPETDPAYWPTVCSLIAHGKPDDARTLLGGHSAFQEDPSGISSPVGAMLLRLDTLIDALPRLTDDEVLAPHHEVSARSLGTKTYSMPIARGCDTLCTSL